MSTQFALKAAPSRARQTSAGMALLVSACAILGAACHIDNPGITPPEGEINYPLVLAMADASGQGDAPRWLHVVNTNFNLRYNRGTLQSLDLETVDAALARSCIDLPDASTELISPKDRCERAGGTAKDGQCCLACLDVPDDGVLCDGRDDPILEACCYFDLNTDRVAVGEEQRQFIPEGGEVRIPSFASGMELSSSGQDLYVSVRSDGTLLKVGVDRTTGELECGQGSDLKCAAGRYVGTESPLPGTEAQFAPLPLDLVVGSAQDFGLEGSAELILTGHENGNVSLFVDDGKGPKLSATLDDVLPGQVASMRRDPHTGMVLIAQDNGQNIDNGQTVSVSQLSRVGIENPSKGEYAPYLTSPLVLTGLIDNSQPRDVAFDPVDSSRLYALVAGFPGPGVDTRSLYFLQLDPTSTNEARTIIAERVGRGPARIVQATIAGSSFLFANCYDDRIMYIFQAETKQTVAFVRNLVGPFEIEVDTARERAYLADFESSTVRVVDLRGLIDPSLPKPRVVLTLGTPRTQRGTL